MGVHLPELLHSSAAVTGSPAADTRPPLTTRAAPIAVAIAAALWASDAYFRPALARELSASQIVLLEDAIISACLLPLLLRQHARLRAVSRRSWLALIVVAFGPQAIATVLFTRSLAFAFPAGGAPDFNVANEVYFVYLLQPVIGVSLARVVLGERRRLHFWPLAALALAGVYLIVFSQDPLAPLSSAQHAQLLAGLLALGAVVLWAAGTVMARYALADASFTITASMRFTLALPLLALLVAFDQRAGGFTRYTLAQLPSFAGIALIPGLIGMLMYYRALARTPASLAAIAELGYPCALFLVFSLPPPVGLGAPLHGIEVAGALMLVAAVTSLNLLRVQRLVKAPGRTEIALTPDAIAG